MLIFKNIFLEFLVLIWWVSLWNCMDIVITNFIPIECTFRFNLLIGLTAIFLCYFYK